jgi:hypothetical protein
VKRLSTLFLTAIFVLSVVSVTSASTVTFSPYAVMMWESMQNNRLDDNMFRFTQLGFNTKV